MTSRKITATWTRKTIVECTLLLSQHSIAINYVYSSCFGYQIFNPQLLFTASTHVLVHFLSDNTIVTVPLKRVTQVENEVKCLVKLTDGV